MTEFVLKTDMGDDAVRECVQAAQRLAALAVAQHKVGIKQATAHLEAVLKNLGARLKDETGKSWGVGVLKLPDRPEWVAAHEVFAGAFDGKDVVEVALTVDVVTKNFCDELRPGEFHVGYRTTAKTLLPDDILAESDDEEHLPVYSDICAPLVLGELVK
jgi:hypothetical protein